MLNMDRIKRKRDISSEQEGRNACVASTLARGSWHLISGVVILHMLGIVLLSSLFVVTEIQAERLDRALEALNGSANRLYTLVITLAAPVTIYSYSSTKTKLSKEE